MLWLFEFIGLLGLLELLSPSEIGSPWSSSHTSTGQVAFYPVHIHYRAGGINLLGYLSCRVVVLSNSNLYGQMRKPR